MTSDIVPNGRIVIAGGSGFLGVNLARYLANFDCEVLVISRNRPAQDGQWEHVTWDARTLGDWVGQVDGAAAVVNLVGRTVDCVKSPDHCDEILRSRVEATKLLGEAIRQAETPPPVWVQMSPRISMGTHLKQSAMRTQRSGTASHHSGDGLVGGGVRRGSASSDPPGGPTHPFRTRSQWWCAATACFTCSLGPGRKSWPWTPGYQLDPRTRYESALRASD